MLAPDLVQLRAAEGRAKGQKLEVADLGKRQVIQPLDESPTGLDKATTEAWDLGEHAVRYLAFLLEV
jgi:hypothetical protein